MRNCLLAFVPPAIAGLVLRLAGARSQILTDDEMHTVSGAIVTPLRQIVQNWTLGDADYSAPLAALFRLGMDAGFVFSEMGFRFPSLAAGVVAVVAIPSIFEARTGRRAATVLAWLLALSPMLVLYSRIVRSYMLVVLVAVLAVAAFDRWQRTGRRGAAVGYAALAAISIALHLGSGPFVIAPLAFAAASLGFRRGGVREWMALGRLAAAVAVLTGLLLYPASESIWALIETKRDGHFPEVWTWLDLTRLHAGTANVLLALGVGAALVRGSWILWQRERSFLLYLVCLVAAQVIGLGLLSPDRFEELTVANRYLLMTLPLTLCIAAVGIAEPFAISSGARRAQNAAAVALVAALFASGPLVEKRYFQSSFTHALAFLDFTKDGNRISDHHTPQFYRDLPREQPGELLEHPSLNLAYHSFDAYQREHGWRIRMSSLFREHYGAGVSFHNLIRPSPDAFLESSARYLVVHLDLRNEAVHLESSDPHQRKWLGASELWGPLRRAGSSMAHRLEVLWGTPTYADADIRVWDLAAIRAQRLDSAP